MNCKVEKAIQLSLGPKAEDFELSIPRLMLLGIVFTSSDSVERATRFVESGCQNLENQIEKSEFDLKLFAMIGRLAFLYSIKQYNLNLQLFPKTSTKHALLKNFEWKKV